MYTDLPMIWLNIFVEFQSIWISNFKDYMCKKKRHSFLFIEVITICITDTDLVFKITLKEILSFLSELNEISFFTCKAGQSNRI